MENKKTLVGLLFVGSILLLMGFLLGKSSTNSIQIFSTTPTPIKKTLAAKDNNQPTISSQELFLVTKVVDGDTIQLNTGQAVRYIGIDTPETKDPRKPVQCFGKEAADKNRELVEGKTVRLEKDVSETDRYGRLLRYVFVGDLFINDYLVRQGFAHASAYPPDIKYQDQFREAEQEAREQKRGLWAACGDSSSEQQENQASPKFTGSNRQIEGDKDCSDFKTHDEAQAFFITQGGPASDPHKLDQDKDGNACETLP